MMQMTTSAATAMTMMREFDWADTAASSDDEL